MSRSIIVGVVILTIFISCAKEIDPATDKNTFVKIYDHNAFNASYLPIDIKQTPDGGYLILGEQLADSSSSLTQLSTSYFSKTIILKLDAYGAFVSQQVLSSDKTNPIGPLLVNQSMYYFFTMDPTSLQPQLNAMDTSAAGVSTTNVAGSYPAAAANSNGSFVLLYYDHINKKSVICTLTPDGKIGSSKDFTIGASDAVESVIVSHFNRTGRQFPFQVGKTAAGQYFFNGFYQYTFSLVFTDLTAANPLGVMQGQQDDGGFSALLPMEGNRFATALFNFNDNYILPNALINPIAIGSISNLIANNIPELGAQATVKIITGTVNGKDLILYGSTTKSKQISLYGYDKATGLFVGSRYLGFSNPFEMAAMIVTSDSGLAVCGTTYVAGRFPRICLFKISKEELSKSF